MLAVAEDELGDDVKKGDKVINNQGLIGVVEYGTDENGKETDILGFIKCGPDDYLVAVKGKLILSWRKL